MSSLQVSASFRPQIDVKQISGISTGVSSITSAYFPAFQIPRTRLKLTVTNPSHQRCPPICVFGESGKSEYSNQENAIGDSGKKLSLEEILRQQIERQESSGEGPPSDGGGGRGRGGGGGGGDDFGGSEEETPGEMLDELLQVTLSTLGLILLYVYILHGPEINVLAKDYFRFIFTGRKSVRLKRAMYVWGRLLKSLTRKKKSLSEEDTMLLLQRQILSTPTWFDSPAKYRQIAKAYRENRLYEDE